MTTNEVKEIVSNALEDIIKLINSNKQETEEVMSNIRSWQEDHRKEHKEEKEEGNKLLTDILLKINTIAVKLETGKDRLKTSLTIAALIISIGAIIFGFFPKP